MQQIKELPQKGLMTSLELVKQINIFRAEERANGSTDRLYADIAHDSLLKIIREEFEEEISLGEINESNYTNERGREYPKFDLTLSQAKQVLVRESKIVRKAMIAYIEKLEGELLKPKEMTKKEILLLALESEERALAAESKILQLQPKVEAFDRVIDNSTTYTLDTVSDIINVGRTKLSEKLKQIGWAMKDSSKGTSSTRKVEEIGYARTFFETIMAGQKEIKIKKIVITKKGLDYLVNNYYTIFA
jgi:anti-repressor protein